MKKILPLLFLATSLISKAAIFSGTTSSSSDLNNFKTINFSGDLQKNRVNVLPIVINSGSGLIITGTSPDFTITATSVSDKTVTITGLGTATVAGTYPVFTINTPKQNTVTIAGAGINSVTGIYPGFTITATETQTLSISGSTISLSGGSSVTVPSSSFTLAVSAGIYTPTLTSFSNLDAATSYQVQYIRVGNVVTMSGKITVDPTAGGTTTLNMSLPVLSNISAEQSVGGTAYSRAPDVEGAAIFGDAANDKATFEWSSSTGSSHDMFFSFTYLIQ